MKKLIQVGARLFIVMMIGYGVGQAMETVSSLAPVQTPQPDSIVQITAEMQGLQPVAFSELPIYGTFWEVMPGGCMAPLPAPIFDSSLPIYAITDNIFLVDATGGQLAINSRQADMLSAAGGATAVVQAEATAVANLIEQVQASQAPSPLAAGPRTMTAMDSELSGPPGFGDTSTNSYSPDGMTNTFPTPDYGTNLWIASTAIGAGLLSGMGSNTIADVVYTIQVCSDLALGNWQNDGSIYGSELTNWTALSVAQNGWTNMFVRLRSEQSSDGSGLPNWWEALYFGTNAVNPNAQDSAGDGYTIYQKYELGVNPNAFYTPAAPQSLTVAYNANNSTATLNWFPSPGNVTGYTLQKTDSNYSSPSVQTIHLSSTTTSYQDSLSGNTPEPNWPYGGNYAVSYRIMANYANGQTSPWSASIPVQQITVTAYATPGPNGTTALAVSGVPANAADIRLAYIDQDAISGGDTSQDYNVDIPVSSFANGTYYMATASFMPTNGDDYAIYAESVDANGNASGANQFDDSLEGETELNAGTPFYDGRVQLKQNLIFELRAAAVDAPFHFSYGQLYTYTYPSNYASVGLYDYAGTIATYGSFDYFLPFEENNLFRNFAFEITEANIVGALTNGVIGDGISPDYYYDLSNPTFQFNSSLPVFEALLATNLTQWLVYDQSSDSDDLEREGVVNGAPDGAGNFVISLRTGKYNWFGLPYISVNIVVPNSSGTGPATNIVTAGHSTTIPGNYIIQPNIYVQTAQPGFQTLEYDSWVQINGGYVSPPLPGSLAFSPTSQVPPLITSVANDYFQIASYAKLAVTNSAYSGVFGYLGQYFANAYIIDTNGIVTTNTTGVLSPYGNFFATQPGPVALVTMPDPDTGAQGTSIVHCISLVLDKNHDLVMDKSFNGPDATSQSSPFCFWINDDYDYSGASWDLGHDVEAGWYYNDGYQRVIGSQRDLEDYARLWICGMPALTNGNYQVTLSWANVSSGSPTINLFNSVETNGGVGYLTNSTIAAAQYGGLDNNYPGSPGKAIATISPGQPFTFPASYFTSAGDKHFLFDGAITNGAGELLMTIADNSGNTIAQTGAWLDLHRITDFYEFAQATNVPSTVPPSSLVSQYSVIHPGLGMGNETKQVIVYVHGINRPAWGAQNEGETLFKRLYWSGYQGHFAEFRWPCAYLPPNSWWPYTFNESEFWAYKAAPAFKNYLSYLKNRPDLAGYAVDVLAHSQGNAVVSEALFEGATINNYILSQGAVPAQCYDGSAPTLPVLMTAEASTPTPFAASIGGYNQCWTNISGNVGNIVNFFNVNDFALATGSYGPLDANWVKNQQSQKPEAFIGGPSYIYYPSNQTSVAYYTFGSHYTVTDWEESRSMVARSRTSAIGAQGPATGQTAQGIIGGSVDLFGELGFGNTRPEHSAQFTRPIQTVWGYYDQILRSFQILPVNRQ